MNNSVSFMAVPRLVGVGVQEMRPGERAWAAEKQ
jgi:hypothetical protein